MRDYAELMEHLAGEGIDTSFADSGINPFKDQFREEEEEEGETAEDDEE